MSRLINKAHAGSQGKPNIHPVDSVQLLACAGSVAGEARRRRRPWQQAGSSNATGKSSGLSGRGEEPAEPRIRRPSPSRKHRHPAAWAARKKKSCLALVLSKARGSGWLCLRRLLLVLVGNVRDGARAGSHDADSAPASPLPALFGLGVWPGSARRPVRPFRRGLFVCLVISKNKPTRLAGWRGRCC